MGLDHGYQKVSAADDLNDQAAEKPSQMQSPWRKHSVLVSITMGTILVAVFVAIFARHSSSTQSTPSSTPQSLTNQSSTDETDLAFDPEKNIKGCGSTAEEARALGCVFDVMMQLWTPEECYDGVLSERFLAANNWTWWADPTAEHVIPDDIMALGEHKVVYTSPDYHKTHCIFSWEKLVRAMRTQQPIIEQLISYDHVLHCRHKTLGTDNAHGAIAPVVFTRCASYEDWLKALPENRHSSTDK